MRRTRILAFVIFTPVLAWLLWPAADARFQIVDDPAKMAQKQAFFAKTGVSTEGQRKNIVLILADDLGKHDLTLYGNAPTQTPHIDSIAKDGAAMSEGYITSPICAPSRAALMTGRYQQRFGFETITHERYPRNRLEWLGAKFLMAEHGWKALDEIATPPSDVILREGLPPSEITIAELLKTRGYATAIFGKWHLGFNEQAIPIHRGFDYHYGFYEAFSLYQDPSAPDVVNARDDHFADRYQWSRGRHGNCAIRRNGVEINETVYLTESIAKETVAWIGAHKDEPFFAYVPFSAPHAPLQAPRAYVDRFAHVKDPKKRVYYAMIASLDDAVGAILAELDRDGLRDNTLVMFLSDNGGAAYNGTTDNTPLSGGKLTNFEGGVNVPFAMRDPANIRPGTIYREPVSALDLFSTMIAVSGASLPSGRVYDGVNLLPYLREGASGVPHDAIYWRAEGHRAIRAGAYKLVSDKRTGSRALFNLEKDKSEANNLLTSDKALADALEAQLQAWETELVQPAWPRVMDYHFSMGGQDYIFPL